MSRATHDQTRRRLQTFKQQRCLERAKIKQPRLFMRSEETRRLRERCGVEFRVTKTARHQPVFLDQQLRAGVSLSRDPGNQHCDLAALEYLLNHLHDRRLRHFEALAKPNTDAARRSSQSGPTKDRKSVV